MEKRAEQQPMPGDHILSVEQDRARSDNDALRHRSGSIELSSKLSSFLYDLLRDHLPAGTVEKLVRDAQVTPVRYCNGYLARYAEDIAERLL